MRAWNKHWQLKSKGRATSKEYFVREVLGFGIDECEKQSNQDDSQGIY